MKGIFFKDFFQLVTNREYKSVFKKNFFLKYSPMLKLQVYEKKISKKIFLPLKIKFFINPHGFLSITPPFQVTLNMRISRMKAKFKLDYMK